jgi:low affinity Fe/Cu permease
MTNPRSWMTFIGTWLARPAAFAVLGAYVVAWGVFSRESLLDWHAIATIATWAMTLFIQRAEHRDTQAVHAKLDEILRSHGEMNSELSHVDDQEPEDIERLREHANAGD